MTRALDLLAALDPCELARRVGLPPDPWQEQFLRSASDRQIICAGRQVGKSSSVAVKATHLLLYEAPALVLLVSPTQDQSSELFKVVKSLYRRLGNPVPSVTESERRMELANGSRILSLPGSEASVRGYSNVRLLVLDEASRIPEELLAATLPMLSVSRGKLVAASTPWFARGWFFQTWTSPDVTWERYHVRSSECPRIDPAFLAEQRRLRGEPYYRTEFEAEFLDSQFHIFSEGTIRRMFERRFKPWVLSPSASIPRSA